jgi:hypothetical protein
MAIRPVYESKPATRAESAIRAAHGWESNHSP